MVAFLEQLRAATYRASADGTLRLPVTLVLDEVANIAPLPDLPQMVSEGGGQSLLTMACLQDLSQARARGGPPRTGFFSLFGAKVLLPGVGDLRTLDTVSRLAGQGDVATRSVNTSAWWSGHPSTSTTYSTRRQERLPADQVHSLAPGTALAIAGARPPRLAALTPWWGYPPFSEAGSVGNRPSCRYPRAPLPAPLALPWAPPALPPPFLPTHQEGPPKRSGDLPVTWRRVPGQRRPRPPSSRL